MRRLIRRLIGNEEIDRVLSREEEILPSSGFAVSVMDAVRREAAVPPPIPFPWKRALPGLVVGGFVLALVLATGTAAIARLVRASAAADFPIASLSVPPPMFQGNLEYAAIWTVLALVVALASVKLSMRLGSGGR
jgi:hypothetical protein